MTGGADAARPYKDSISAHRLQIRIAPDGMVALACVTPGEPAGTAQVSEALRAVGVDSGIDDEACSRLARSLTDPDFAVTDLELAHGSTPTRDDGALELEFDPEIMPGTRRSDGSFDFLERALLRPVERGQVLAHYRRPGPGTPGRRVDGIEIPVLPGIDRLVELGPGAQLHEDGTIRATLDGVVRYVGGSRLDVVRHYAHNADVALASGNLTMDGSVSATGSIQRGLAVRATADVAVRGGVHSGMIIAGGDVSVGGGVIGGEPVGFGSHPPPGFHDMWGSVHAGGSVRATHAHRAWVHAGTRLELTKDSVQARLEAPVIEVKGRVVGGCALAQTDLVVGGAGSGSGTPTLLSAGELVESPLEDVRAALKSAKHIRRARRRGGSRRSKGGRVSRDHTAHKRQHLERAQRRCERRRELAAAARVDVVRVAHPGVVVAIAGVRLELLHAVRRTRFTFDTDAGALRQEGLPR